MGNTEIAVNVSHFCFQQSESERILESETRKLWLSQFLIRNSKVHCIIEGDSQFIYYSSFGAKNFHGNHLRGTLQPLWKKMVGWCRPNSIVHRPFFIHVNDAQTVVNYSLWENIVIFILGGKWPNEYNIYYNGVLSFHYNCGEEFKHWTLNLRLLTHIIIIITSRLIN